MEASERIGAYRVVARADEDADPMLVVRFEEVPGGPLFALRRLDARDVPRARAIIGAVGQKSDAVPSVPQTVVEQGASAFVVSHFTPHLSLRRLLEGCFDKRRRLAPHVAAQLVARACHELASLGVTHGALDLARIGVDPRGDVVVLGLGASHAQLDERAMPDTRRIGYLAPELDDAASADPRADVFSLGVILWEALTLRRLFPASSDADARARMRGAAVPPPTTLARDVPEQLEAVVMRALALDPDTRFASPSLFAAALGGVAQAVSSGELARLARTLVDPTTLAASVPELAKAWRGVESDPAVLDALASPLPTFFPKSFGDEPVRPKRLATQPPRTQTLIGVTSPVAQQAMRAAQASAGGASSGVGPAQSVGRVPQYKPKAATLVGIMAPQLTAPRATYAEPSVPTNPAPALPISTTRRSTPPPVPEQARRADATKANANRGTVPPPLPPGATRWSDDAAKTQATPKPVTLLQDPNRPSLSPAPVPAAAPSPDEGWDDEDTTFYAKGSDWDEEAKTEITDLPPVDQLPTTTLPQRGIEAKPAASEAVAPPPAAPAAPASKVAPVAMAPSAEAPKAKPLPAPTSAARATAAASPRLGQDKSPPKPVVPATPRAPAATTAAPVPTPEVKPQRTPLGAPPKRVVPAVAVPAKVVHVGTPSTPSSPTTPAAPTPVSPTSTATQAPAPSISSTAPLAPASTAPAQSPLAPAPTAAQIPIAAPSHASTRPAPPPQDPSWSALLESSAGTHIDASAPPPPQSTEPAAIDPRGVQPAHVIPPPAFARLSPDAPTLSEAIPAPAPVPVISVPPSALPPGVARKRAFAVAAVLLGLVVVAFAIGRVTAPEPPSPAPLATQTTQAPAPTPPAPTTATPPPAPTVAVVPAPTPAPPEPAAAVDAGAPEAAPEVAEVTPEPPPAPEPPPTPAQPEPPPSTATPPPSMARARPAMTSAMAAPTMTVTMSTMAAPAMTTGRPRPVIRAPDF